MYQYSLSYFTCLFRSLTFEPEAMPRKNVNEKSTATSDVILNKALTKPAYHKKKDP